MKQLTFIFLLASMIAACKKDPPPPAPSSEKRILTFVLRFSDNPGLLTANVLGVITGDTIKLGVPPGVPLTSLVPYITYSGADLTPQSQVMQNFSSPVEYTVTAEDGTKHKYIVVAKNLSTTKEIISFQFRSSDNPGAVTSDLTGVIKNDTIWVSMAYTPAISGLKPFITHSGVSIQSESGLAKDFTQPVVYSVNAEDGTARYYTVIVKYNHSVYFGSNDGYIYSLDATTGKLQWKYATGNPVGCSPVIDNGVLFAFSGTTLYAIDAETGVKKWETSTTYGITTSPCVSNGVVFVASSGPENKIHAFNAATGNGMWSKPLGYAATANPVVAGSVVIVGDAGFGTYTFQVSDGTPGWAYGTGITRGGAAVVNGSVFVGSETQKLLKIDFATGLFRGAYIDGFLGSGSAPTITNGVAYIGTYDKHLAAVDTGTMTEKWKYKLANSRDFGSPVVANGIVYAGNNDSYLYAVDANTGAMKWMFGTGHQQDPNIGIINPTVANGIVYVGNYDKKFYALNAASGAVKWSFETGAPVYSGPCVVEANNKLAYPGVSGHQQ